MSHLSDRIPATYRSKLLEDPALVERFGASLLGWPEDEIRRHLASKLALPWLDIDNSFVSEELFLEIGVETCRKFGFLPAYRNSLAMHVFMADPFHAPSIRALRNKFYREIHPIGTTARGLDRTLTWLAATDLGRSHATAARPDQPPEALSWRYKLAEGVRFIERVLLDAHARGASDIFFETYPSIFVIRYKIHGACVVMPPIEPRHASKILSDAKAFATMAPNDQRGYRDGSAEIVLANGGVVNFRVVAQRTLSGESMTFRVLDKNALERMGKTLPFPEPEATIMRRLLTQKQGIIYVVGPTGSGKTTTLWRCLLSMDSASKKIMTIEDPVEYRFDQVVQLPVKSEKKEDGVERKETFSGALRSCLRAAPDVILVGEIRDKETAEVSTEAALTGHLILTTIHTPDAIGVIPRLLDKGVTALNIRQTLTAVVAQRLVPRICRNCRIPALPSSLHKKHLDFHGLKHPESLYVEAGCPDCGSSGRVGMVPVFEFLVPDDRMLASITDDFNEVEFRDMWYARGGKSLGKYALELARRGEVAYSHALALDRSFAASLSVIDREDDGGS